MVEKPRCLRLGDSKWDFLHTLSRATCYIFEAAILLKELVCVPTGEYTVYT